MRPAASSAPRPARLRSAPSPPSPSTPPTNPPPAPRPAPARSAPRTAIPTSPPPPVSGATPRTPGPPTSPRRRPPPTAPAAPESTTPPAHPSPAVNPNVYPSTGSRPANNRRQQGPRPAGRRFCVEVDTPRQLRHTRAVPQVLDARTVLWANNPYGGRSAAAWSEPGPAAGVPLVSGTPQQRLVFGGESVVRQPAQPRRARSAVRARCSGTFMTGEPRAQCLG